MGYLPLPRKSIWGGGSCCQLLLFITSLFPSIISGLFSHAQCLYQAVQKQPQDFGGALSCRCNLPTSSVPQGELLLPQTVPIAGSSLTGLWLISFRMWHRLWKVFIQFEKHLYLSQFYTNEYQKAAVLGCFLPLALPSFFCPIFTLVIGGGFWPAVPLPGGDISQCWYSCHKMWLLGNKPGQAIWFLRASTFSFSSLNHYGGRDTKNLYCFLKEMKSSTIVIAFQGTGRGGNSKSFSWWKNKQKAKRKALRNSRRGGLVPGSIRRGGVEGGKELLVCMGRKSVIQLHS